MQRLMSLRGTPNSSVEMDTTTEGVDFQSLPICGGKADVRCLNGGSFIASLAMLHANSGSGTLRLYNWCFLIHDRISGRRVMWDLGMTSVCAPLRSFPTHGTNLILQDRSCYATVAANVMESVQAVGPQDPIVDQLARYNVSSSAIDTVIFRYGITLYTLSACQS